MLVSDTGSGSIARTRAWPLLEPCRDAAPCLGPVLALSSLWPPAGTVKVKRGPGPRSGVVRRQVPPVGLHYGPAYRRSSNECFPGLPHGRAGCSPCLAAQAGFTLWVPASAVLGGYFHCHHGVCFRPRKAHPDDGRWGRTFGNVGEEDAQGPEDPLPVQLRHGQGRS